MTLSSETVYDSQYQLICEDDNMYEDLKQAVSESVVNAVLVYNDWAGKAEENLEMLGLDHAKHREYSFASWLAFAMTEDDRNVLSIDIRRVFYGMADRDAASSLGDFYANFLEANGMLEVMLSDLGMK